MFEINDCVKLIDVTDDILKEIMAERYKLEGKFFIINIDVEDDEYNVAFPYCLQSVDDENLIFWVREDEIEYA